MESRRRELLKRLLIVPPLVLGVAILVLMARGREGPERVPPGEQPRAVRVIAVPSVAVVPRALGHGVVTPGMVWEAVAEVAGKVAQIHPALKKGAVLEAGEVLLSIDQADYRLAEAEAEAEIRSVRAEFAELEARESNTRASLAIEQRALDLSETELERKRRLLERGNVARSAVDQEERAMLDRRQRAQSLNNTLNLIPAERQALEAKGALYEARLAEARLDLERTVIALPFDARIAEVTVEASQFVRAGETLVVADSIDVAEVEAQVPIDKMRHLVSGRPERPDLTPAELGRMPELLGLSAVVRLHAGDFTVEWPARFARISDTIDPETRTVGVIVAVDDPYRQARPGLRPPLIKNMFVEVEVRGRPRPPGPIVPRAALHRDRVYVAGADDRLERRRVEVGFFQTNFVTIAGGLSAGERVVVSDLAPAVDGMLLAPVVDEGLVRSLVAEAEARGGVR
ncbi:MAG: efflux RND transporter periplasmic adaptor subunit [Alphaproteobacteria bacterium]